MNTASGHSSKQRTSRHRAASLCGCLKGPPWEHSGRRRKRTLALDTRGARQRDDFREPGPCAFPRAEKDSIHYHERAAFLQSAVTYRGSDYLAGCRDSHPSWPLPRLFGAISPDLSEGLCPGLPSSTSPSIEQNSQALGRVFCFVFQLTLCLQYLECSISLYIVNIFHHMLPGKHRISWSLTFVSPLAYCQVICCHSMSCGTVSFYYSTNIYLLIP